MKEDGHIQKLRHLKQSDLNERLLKIEISDLPAIHGMNRKEWFITAQDDMKRILEIALERESTAENFYSGLYRKANDGTIRKLFFLLANEEKQHFEDIKRLQSKLLNQQGEM
ncbi:MAG: ferritin family protein [Candidatus Auribacterota bacterium]